MMDVKRFQYAPRAQTEILPAGPTYSTNARQSRVSGGLYYIRIRFPPGQSFLQRQQSAQR